MSGDREHADPETAAPEAATAPDRAGPASAPLIARVLALQATAGNRAVARALATTSGRAVARTPTLIRENVSEARLGGRAAYGGLVTYEVEFIGGNCQLTMKVRLVPDANVTADEVTRVQQETSREFARIWDNKFELTDTTSHDTFPLRMTLTFVASGEHKSISLHRGNGSDNETDWFVGSASINRAHELGHTLGPNDEYVDATVVGRATATSPDVHRDNSIMGQYYEEGIEWAEAKLRHGQNLAARIGRTTGRTLTVRLTTAFLVERGERYRAHERALPAGAEHDAVAAERARIEAELRVRTGYAYHPATL
jgi:hypothetical protein